MSENAQFARRCAELGLTLIGPRPALLEGLGGKVQARALAAATEVPVLAHTGGSKRPASVEAVTAFFATPGGGDAIPINAVAGGGGSCPLPGRKPERIRSSVSYDNKIGAFEFWSPRALRVTSFAFFEAHSQHWSRACCARYDPPRGGMEKRPAVDAC